MKITKDIFGAEMWDHYKGERHPEIIERDDGFISAGRTLDATAYFSEYKNWMNVDKMAIKNVEGKKVLDIGCGAGRHSLYLQKKGYDVLGIDNSPLSIKICKLRGLKNARVMNISDVGKLKPSSFDSAIMMGNNIGLLGSPEKAKTILKKLHKITTDNGVIIATGIDPYKTDDPIHLSYHKFNKKRGRMPGQLRIRIRHKTLIGPWFDYLFVSKKELVNIVKDTGWKVRSFAFDDTDAFYTTTLVKV